MPDVEQRAGEQPFRETQAILIADLDRLREELHRAEAAVAELSIKVRVREEALKSLAQIAKEAQLSSGREMSLLPDVASRPNGDASLRFTATLALRGVPRGGYGAITQAVQRLLNYNPGGVSAKALAESLKRNGFQVKGGTHESAVRSALKNLRARGIVVHSESTGRYQILLGTNSSESAASEAIGIEEPTTAIDVS